MRSVEIRTAPQKTLAFLRERSIGVVVAYLIGWRHDPCPVEHIDPGLVSVRGQIGWSLQRTRVPICPRRFRMRNQRARKLTDTQLVMMRAALRREDRCLSPLSSLRGAQIVKTGEKLIAAGLAREVKAKSSYPDWRRDAESGAAFALKLTAAGAKAAATADTTSPDNEAGSEDVEPRMSKEPAISTPDAMAQAIAAPPANKLRDRGLPRPTSKLAAVVGLLGRPEGASSCGPHCCDRLASPYDARRAHRVAQARLCRHARSLGSCRGLVYRIEAKPDDGADGGSESAAEAA